MGRRHFLQPYLDLMQSFDAPARLYEHHGGLREPNIKSPGAVVFTHIAGLKTRAPFALAHALCHVLDILCVCFRVYMLGSWRRRGCNWGETTHSIASRAIGTRVPFTAPAKSSCTPRCVPRTGFARLSASCLAAISSRSCTCVGSTCLLKARSAQRLPRSTEVQAETAAQISGCRGRF